VADVRNVGSELELGASFEEIEAAAVPVMNQLKETLRLWLGSVYPAFVDDIAKIRVEMGAV
jgi:hypothetical protein